MGFRAVLDDFREDRNVLSLPGVEQEFRGRPALRLLIVQRGKFMTC